MSSTSLGAGSAAIDEPSTATTAATTATAPHSTANSGLSTLPSAASSSTSLLHAGDGLPPPPPSQRLPAGAGSSSSDLPRYLHLHSASVSSLLSTASQTTGTSAARSPGRPGGDGDGDSAGQTRHRPSSPLRGLGRAHLRLSTIKSAILIYFTLLGLSPILKSLTRSTSSDSIWAMSFWLLAINIFFFDYSGAWVGVNKFPVASLSTNAALMASTVLASRLPSTGQVFSLTLFSIEVFGLFPVFRRYARHRSWRYHVVLTVLLVLGAGAGVGMILSGRRSAAGRGAAACSAWPSPWPWPPWPWAAAAGG